jgi:hypothetical protein
MCLPTDIEKQWSFAGMIVEQGQEGRMNEGTIFWGGVPSMTWVSSSILSHLHAMLTGRSISTSKRGFVG